MLSTVVLAAIFAVTQLNKSNKLPFVLSFKNTITIRSFCSRKMKGSDNQEKLVYQVIEDAGNKGELTGVFFVY